MHRLSSHHSRKYISFLLSLNADHGLRLINWPYVNHQRVFMIGRSCLCPKGWPPFISHWMKGSKLKGKSSKWWGGIQSKDKQCSDSSVRLSVFWKTSQALTGYLLFGTDTQLWLAWLDLCIGGCWPGQELERGKVVLYCLSRWEVWVEWAALTGWSGHIKQQTRNSHHIFFHTRGHERMLLATPNFEFDQ